MDTKVCTKCDCSKPFSDYGIRRLSKDGLTFRCKQCLAGEREQNKTYTAKYRKNNKERIKCSRMQRDYGITLATVEGMVQSQSNRCLVCSKTFKDSKDTHVDHCHTTGKVRGILCAKCNTGLGLMDDSPSILRMAAAYLEYNNE